MCIRDSTSTTAQLCKKPWSGWAPHAGAIRGAAYPGGVGGFLSLSPLVAPDASRRHVSYAAVGRTPHPQTAAPTLYCPCATSHYVLGMGMVEARALLTRMVKRVTVLEFNYQYLKISL